MIVDILNFSEDCNVISVDWAPLAGPAPWYGIAVANLKKVGARTGQFIDFLRKNNQIVYEDLHVLGFSLGGQLVAFIGQELNGELPRITGLDPAGKIQDHAISSKSNMSRSRLNN